MATGLPRSLSVKKDFFSRQNCVSEAVWSGPWPPSARPRAPSVYLRQRECLEGERRPVPSAARTGAGSPSGEKDSQRTGQAASRERAASFSRAEEGPRVGRAATCFSVTPARREGLPRTQHIP